VREKEDGAAKHIRTKVTLHGISVLVFKNKIPPSFLGGGLPALNHSALNEQRHFEIKINLARDTKKLRGLPPYITGKIMSYTQGYPVIIGLKYLTDRTSLG
jgi:hypothetical protein